MKVVIHYNLVLWLQLFFLQKTQKMSTLHWQSALCLREKCCSDCILYDCSPPPPPPNLLMLPTPLTLRLPRPLLQQPATLISTRILRIILKALLDSQVVICFPLLDCYFLNISDQLRTVECKATEVKQEILTLRGIYIDVWNFSTFISTRDFWNQAIYIEMYFVSRQTIRRAGNCSQSRRNHRSATSYVSWRLVYTINFFVIILEILIEMTHCST
jgi:hypothetical protein